MKQVKQRAVAPPQGGLKPAPTRAEQTANLREAVKQRGIGSANQSVTCFTHGFDRPGREAGGEARGAARAIAPSSETVKQAGAS
jgi:hypothetical protein